MGRDAEIIISKVIKGICNPDILHTKIIPRKFISEEGKKMLCKHLILEEEHQYRYCDEQVKAPEIIMTEDEEEDKNSNRSVDTLRSEHMEDTADECNPFEE